MSFPEKVACSVLWNLIALGFFALDFLIFRHIAGLSEVIATGAAVVLSTVFVVGVPEWGKTR